MNDEYNKYKRFTVQKQAQGCFQMRDQMYKDGFHDQMQKAAAAWKRQPLLKGGGNQRRGSND